MRSSVERPQQQLANRLMIVAPLLYLLNLLIIPGIAFLILAVLYVKYKSIDHAEARIQLQQNFWASVIAGIAIVGVTGLIILVGGFGSMYGWMVALIYAVSIHACLVLLGAISLARGMNQQSYCYPGLAFLTRDIKQP